MDPVAARCRAAAGRRQGGEVPVVDLGGCLGAGASRAEREAVVGQIAEACEGVGFFTIVNHGIDAALLARVAAAAKAFFAQDSAEKAKVAAGSRAYGFFPMDSEALGYDADVAKRPDLREAFSMGPLAKAPEAVFAKHREVATFCYEATPWPEAGELQGAMTEYYGAVGRLAEALLGIFAEALEVDAELFLSKVRHHASSLRAIHYPKLEHEPLPGQLRCGEHSDICTMTILWQDAHGGLEVLPRGCEQWMEVRCPPDGLVVNLGDLFARWTNDRWLSTPHRVACPDVEDAERNVARISVPYFQILASDAEVRCIPSCLGAGEEPKYAPTTQGEDLMAHFRRWGRNREE